VHVQVPQVNFTMTPVLTSQKETVRTASYADQNQISIVTLNANWVGKLKLSAEALGFSTILPAFTIQIELIDPRN